MSPADITRGAQLLDLLDAGELEHAAELARVLGGELLERWQAVAVAALDLHAATDRLAALEGLSSEARRAAVRAEWQATQLLRRARLELGRVLLCGCGCGAGVPEGTLYVDVAHKQRAYRARRASGRVIPAAIRRAELEARRAGEQAAALDDEIRRLEEQIERVDERLRAAAAVEVGALASPDVWARWAATLARLRTSAAAVAGGAQQRADGLTEQQQQQIIAAPAKPRGKRGKR